MYEVNNEETTLKRGQIAANGHIYAGPHPVKGTPVYAAKEDAPGALRHDKAQQYAASIGMRVPDEHETALLESVKNVGAFANTFKQASDRKKPHHTKYWSDTPGVGNFVVTKDFATGKTVHFNAGAHASLRPVL